MSDFPTTLRYSKEHEWARLEDDGSVTIGITSHAVEALGDITMVTLPDVGGSLEVGENFGDIDSVKAVSELYAPIDGEVLAINEELEDSPEDVNEEPYQKGWMVRVKPAKAEQLESLMDAEAYAALVASLED
jgi:glycine cleavage system H protein